MQPLLKPIAAFMLLFPLVVAAAAPAAAPAATPAAAPARETTSINAAVADLMKGGAPVAPATPAVAPAGVDKPVMTPEQAVQRAIQAPAVVGEEPLTKNQEPAKADKATPAPKEEIVIKKADTAPAKTEKPVVKAKKVAKPASALSWSEKANTAGREVAPKAVRLNEYEVSDTDYNRFVFPVAVTQVISPAGANLLSPPLYMAGNKHVLLKLASATNRPVQVVAELEDNTVQEFYLKPAPIRGITRELGVREYRSRQVRDAEATEASTAATPSAADMRLLEKFSTGQLPGDFEEEPNLPPEVHFERFWVKPIAVWSNGGNTRVEAWRLIGRPGLAATVAPPQFYRQGVRAVLLENDVVDGRTHPLLLLVTENYEE